jgi:hypothetical protein
VSVSSKTKARLRKAADRAYGGNVSALIEAIALEPIGKKRSIGSSTVPTVDDDAFEAFVKEMVGPVRKRARRVA